MAHLKNSIRHTHTHIHTEAVTHVQTCCGTLSDFRLLCLFPLWLTVTSQAAKKKKEVVALSQHLDTILINSSSCPDAARSLCDLSLRSEGIRCVRSVTQAGSERQRWLSFQLRSHYNYANDLQEWTKKRERKECERACESIIVGTLTDTVGPQTPEPLHSGDLEFYLQGTFIDIVYYAVP